MADIVLQKTKTPFIDKYLGGYDHVTGLLVDLITKERLDRELSTAALTAQCGLGQFPGLPSVKTLEQTPRAINACVLDRLVAELEICPTAVVRHLAYSDPLSARLRPELDFVGAKERHDARSLSTKTARFLYRQVLTELDAVAQSN